MLSTFGLGSPSLLGQALVQSLGELSERPRGLPQVAILFLKVVVGMLEMIQGFLTLFERFDKFLVIHGPPRPQRTMAPARKAPNNPARRCVS
jgi:hypothetical protein